MKKLGCECKTGLGATDWADIAEFGPLAGMSTDPGATSTGYSWNDVFKQGTRSAFSILQNRYGGLAPGTYLQQGNSIAYRVPQNSLGLSAFPQGIGVGENTSGILLLGALGLGAIFIIKAISK